MQPQKVAIVGSGCSGIGAAWALKSTNHEVHIYEANDRLGGHTNTVTFRSGELETPVDTGFIVMNTATYREFLGMFVSWNADLPFQANFIAFLKNLGIHTKETQMTFGVSRDEGSFEWAGTSLSAVFAQKENIFKPKMWQMIFDIIRFNQFALDLLAAEDESEVDPVKTSGSRSKVAKPRQISIGEYLDENNYSDIFRNDYLIPMTACVWSTSPDKVSLQFPAITLIRFLWNHHLLNTVSARAPWMTIPGGTKQYIAGALKGFPEDRIHMNSSVESVKSTANGKPTIHFKSGSEEIFDHVILATHGDQAKEMIRDGASSEENKIMSAFTTNANTAVLHSDLSLMPKREVAWSAWNYITRSPAHSDSPTSVCLTYSMNILQHIPFETFGPVLVTLNPLHKPDPTLSQGSWLYHHPHYNADAIRSQELLPRIQNTRGISYAGAWTKYGFHEDGFSSGLKVAVDHLGAKLPFDFVDSTFARGRRPVLNWKDRVLRFILWWIQVFIVIGTAIFGYLFDEKSDIMSVTK